MLSRFSASVTRSGGRKVAVHPDLQIVRPIVAGVTAGFSAPGVQLGSGRVNVPDPIAWHDPGAGWRCTTKLLAVEYTSLEPPAAPAPTAAPSGISRHSMLMPLRVTRRRRLSRIRRRRLSRTLRRRLARTLRHRLIGARRLRRARRS